MTDKQQRFTDLLKSIFELDKSDLDFGIYRIMNIRRDKILDFFENGLPEKIEEALKPFAAGNIEGVKEKLTVIENEAKQFGFSGIDELPDGNPKKAEYIKLSEQLKAGADLAALESDVYSALYNFFNRYYDEGDFISKRRYKKDVYSIPYEGEEVKLYWANQDQYYIKTSENFKDYTFIEDGLTVHFRLVDATTEQNNNKESDDKKRQFMLYAEDSKVPEIKTFEYDDKKKELIIRFIFDIPADKKTKWAEENAKAIHTYLITERKDIASSLMRNVSVDPKKPLTVIEKHLKGYVAKNTFDYFIHKDLRSFLSRELDFFIKSEIMHLDDLDTENETLVGTYLAKVKAIKRVGKIIIDFLAQIEDFQKKLWLKKKFVVETNWCITLDRIDESFYPDIIKNEAQIKEWVEMYGIDKIESDLTHIGYSLPLRTDFLLENKGLILDTKHFSDSFKEKLIASIDNLDKQSGGLMINADNFHALNLLQTKYKGGIKCSYIDPPYNAKSSKILYKNSFEHSSWLSLIENRVSLAKNLLNQDSVSVTAIDEVENEKLGLLLDAIYKPMFDGKYCISSVINPSGQQGKNFSTNHENLYFYFHDTPNMLGKEARDEDTADIRNFMNGSVGESGDYKRETGKNCFYPIYIKDNTIVDIGDVCDDSFHPTGPNMRLDDGTIAVYPVDQDGVERKWLFERNTVDDIIEELSIDVRDGQINIIRTKTAINYKTVWKYNSHSAKTYGTGLLKDLFGKGYRGFSFPKSLYAVQDCIRIAVNQNNGVTCLDYFAGSGTTGHAVINLNREGYDNKYILVEMGDYFKTATHPRVKKAIYSSAWKNGTPLKRDDTVSHIMKYLRLESYEDALNNIELKDYLQTNIFGEDYLVNYMLDIESKGSLLNLGAFTSPFEYKMKITEKNECKERKVDVCETFNYLIGLSVATQGMTAYYDVKSADNPIYEGAVDLKKNVSGKYGFKQIDGTLPDGRGALVIWRTISDDILESNAALDAYFQKYRINPLDREYDVIFVNGDNNLENLKLDSDTWKVVLIEKEFNERMFEEV